MEHATQAYRDRLLSDLKQYFEPQGKIENWETFLHLLEVFCQQNHILSEHTSLFDALLQLTAQEKASEQSLHQYAPRSEEQQGFLQRGKSRAHLLNVHQESQEKPKEVPERIEFELPLPFMRKQLAQEKDHLEDAESVENVQTKKQSSFEEKAAHPQTSSRFMHSFDWDDEEDEEEDESSTEPQQTTTEALELDAFLEEHGFEVDLQRFLNDPEQREHFKWGACPYLVNKADSIYFNLHKLPDFKKQQLKDCIEDALKEIDAIDLLQIKDKCWAILELGECAKPKTCLRQILRFFFGDDYGFHNSLVRRKDSEKSDLAIIEEQFAKFLGERDFCCDADLKPLKEYIGWTVLYQVARRVDDDRFTLAAKLELENKQAFIAAVLKSLHEHGGCVSLEEVFAERAAFGKVYYPSHLEQPWTIYLLAQLIDIHFPKVIALRRSSMYYGYLFLRKELHSDTNALAVRLADAHQQGLIDLSNSSTNMEQALSFLPKFISKQNLKGKVFNVPATGIKLYLEKLVNVAWKIVQTGEIEL